MTYHCVWGFRPQQRFLGNIIKTTKLPNEIKPSTNVLSLVHRTINLPENSKEPTYNKTEKTSKLPNKVKPSTKFPNCVHQTINLLENSKEPPTIKLIGLLNYQITFNLVPTYHIVFIKLSIYQ